MNRKNSTIKTKSSKSPVSIKNSLSHTLPKEDTSGFTIKLEQTPGVFDNNYVDQTDAEMNPRDTQNNFLHHTEEDDYMNALAGSYGSPGSPDTPGKQSLGKSSVMSEKAYLGTSPSVIMIQDMEPEVSNF